MVRALRPVAPCLVVPVVKEPRGAVAIVIPDSADGSATGPNLFLLVVALIAGFLAWGVASDFMRVAKICFMVFLIFAVLSFLGHGYRRSFREQREAVTSEANP
jgi:uncharacterized membrane protein YtjA (UPF0391 family)